MRKILKKIKDEKGSITSVVLVTVLFFIIILSTALMISGTQRKSQLDSEITLKQVYQNQVDDAEKISKSLVVVKAPIPDGYYYVGGTDESGVVISDNIADKDRYSGEENVGKDLEGNQWVWVPVENPSSLYTTVTDGIALSGDTGVKTTKYTNSAIISGQTRVKPGDTSSFREPDLVLGSDGTSYDYANYATAGFSSLANMAETMKSDYEEMIESLEKYKGFYIGRYELTTNGEKTGATQTDVDWYTLYKNCTTLASGSKVKTRMIWGLQWDATCNWLASSGFSITDSSTWGNYSNNTVYGHGSKDIVKVGRQIISMTLLETVGNLPKKRTTPTAELAEEAAITTMALTVRLLFVTATILPSPTAALVLALLYI